MLAVGLWVSFYQLVDGASLMTVGLGTKLVTGDGQFTPALLVVNIYTQQSTLNIYVVK